MIVCTVVAYKSQDQSPSLASVTVLLSLKPALTLSLKILSLSPLSSIVLNNNVQYKTCIIMQPTVQSYIAAPTCRIYPYIRSTDHKFCTILDLLDDYAIMRCSSLMLHDQH